MPLEKQDIEIPLGAGGVDTGRDEKIIDGPKFVQLENCEITEFGALESRLGYKAQGLTAVNVSTVTPLAIATRGVSRVAMSEGTGQHGNIVEYSDSADAWSGQERLPSFLAAESRVIRAGTEQDMIPLDTAYNNGLLFISYESGSSYGVVIYDPTTETILSDNIEDDLGDFTSHPKLSVIDEFVFAFWIDSSNDLQVSKLDSTDVDGGWTSPATVQASVSQTYFDVHQCASQSYIACQSTSAANTYYALRVDNTPNLSTFSSFSSGSAVTVEAIAIHKHQTADFALVVTASGNTVQSNSLAASDLSVDSTDTENFSDVRNIIIGTEFSAGSVGRFLYLTEVAGATPEDNYVDGYSYNTNTGSASMSYVPYYHYGLAHKFYGRSNEIYTDEHMWFGLVRDMSFESQIQTFEYVIKGLLIVSKPCARYARRIANGQTEQGYVPTAVIDDDGQVWFAFAGVTDVSTNNAGEFVTSANISLGMFNKDDNKRLNDVDAHNLTLLSGGWPYAWDGKHAFSLGFPNAPTIASTSQYNGAGNLDNSATYQYKAVYEYTDATGQVWRSAPSVAESVTTSAAGDTIAVKVRSIADYRYQSHMESTRVVLYRTEGDGTVFYKLSANNTTPANYSRDTINFTDVEPDSTLTSNAPVYTEGGVLENDPSPPCEHMAVHKNRLFVVDSENGDLVYSKEFLRGEGIHFSDEFRIPTGSRINRPVGLESMDENLVVFWKDKIGVVYGDGPNDLGEGGTFTLPRIVAYTGVKADERRSIVKTAQGIFYKSKDGIKLLDRSMQVQDIGRDVIDLHTISGTEYKIVGAEHSQKKHQVMFTQGSGAGQAFVLVYDYLLNYWTKYIVNIDGTSNAVGSAMWDDDHVLVADAGTNRIFQQTAGQYYDGLVSSVDTIDVVARTNWIKLDGLQGYKRIWRAWLLGNYKAAHALTVGVDFDYVQDGDTASGDVPWNILDEVNVVTDPKPYQYKLGIPQQQKCEAIQFYIKMNVIGTGPYAVGSQQAELTSLRLEYGIAPRAMRQKNTNQT